MAVAVIEGITVNKERVVHAFIRIAGRDLADQTRAADQFSKRKLITSNAIIFSIISKNESQSNKQKDGTIQCDLRSI